MARDALADLPPSELPYPLPSIILAMTGAVKKATAQIKERTGLRIFNFSSSFRCKRKRAAGVTSKSPAAEGWTIEIVVVVALRDRSCPPLPNGRNHPTLTGWRRPYRCAGSGGNRPSTRRRCHNLPWKSTAFRETGHHKSPPAKTGGFSVRYEKKEMMARTKSGPKSGGENSSRSVPAPNAKARILRVIIFAISHLKILKAVIACKVTYQ